MPVRGHSPTRMRRRRRAGAGAWLAGSRWCAEAVLPPSRTAPMQPLGALPPARGSGRPPRGRSGCRRLGEESGLEGEPVAARLIRVSAGCGGRCAMHDQERSCRGRRRRLVHGSRRRCVADKTQREGGGMPGLGRRRRLVHGPDKARRGDWESTHASRARREAQHRR